MSGLDELLMNLASTLGNASLALDPLAKARLNALDGTRVRFEITLPATSKAVATKNLSLCIAEGQLEFTPDDNGQPGEGENKQPHGIVRGSIPGVLAWLSGTVAGSDTVTFEGDEVILAELAGILSNYEPDLADPLTRLLGGDAAESLIGAAEMAFATFRSFLESASSAARHRAGQNFVSTPKFDTLLTGLDALQLRTDRLAAKVRAAEVRAAEVRAAEVRAAEVRAAETREPAEESR